MRTIVSVAVASSLLLPVAPALADGPSRQDLADLYSLRDAKTYLDSDLRLPPAAPKAVIQMSKRLQKVLGPVAGRYRNNKRGTIFHWGDAEASATLSIQKKTSAQERMTRLVRSARKAGARITRSGSTVQITGTQRSTALKAVSGRALVQATVPGDRIAEARDAVEVLGRDWMFIQPSSRTFDRKYDSTYAAWMLVAAYNGYPTLAGGLPRPDFPAELSDADDLLDVLPKTGQRSALNLLVQSQPNIVGQASGCLQLSGNQESYVIFDTSSGASSRITDIGSGFCPGSDAQVLTDPSVLLPGSTVAQQPPLSKTDIRITKRLRKRLGVGRLDLGLSPALDLTSLATDGQASYVGVSYLWTGAGITGSRTVLSKSTAAAYIKSSLQITRASIELLNSLGAEKPYSVKITRRGKTRIIQANLLGKSTAILMPIGKRRLIEATVRGGVTKARALAVARAVRQESRTIEAGQGRYMQRYAAEGIGWQIVTSINAVLADGADYLVPDWGTFDPAPLWQQIDLDMPDLPNYYVDVTTTTEGCIQISPKPGSTSKQAYLLVDPAPGAHSRVLAFAYGRCPSPAP